MPPSHHSRGGCHATESSCAKFILSQGKKKTLTLFHVFGVKYPSERGTGRGGRRIREGRSERRGKDGNLGCKCRKDVLKMMREEAQEGQVELIIVFRFNIFVWPNT